MNRSSFRAIYRLICDDRVFTNNSNNLQALVESQLLYTLYKLGYKGNTSGFLKSAIHRGISEGQMYNSTWRVVHAFARLKDTYIQWPDHIHWRVESMTNMEQEGFDGVISKVNKTDIVLNYKPGSIFDGKMFWNQKNATHWMYVLFAILKKKLFIS